MLLKLSANGNKHMHAVAREEKVATELLALPDGSREPLRVFGRFKASFEPSVRHSEAPCATCDHAATRLGENGACGDAQCRFDHDQAVSGSREPLRVFGRCKASFEPSGRHSEAPCATCDHAAKGMASNGACDAEQCAFHDRRAIIT